MTDDLAAALPWSIGFIALFTFLSVAAWSSARRKEREAYYKSEAVKKIAEMQGSISEPVLQVLRETMASWKDQPSPANMGPIQSKAYYRAETIKKLAEMPGANTQAVLTMIREDERFNARRVREGLKLGGAINLAVGFGLIVFLWSIVPEKPVYLAGFIPILVGVVLLAFGFLARQHSVAVD
jgi:hypothetical protein